MGCFLELTKMERIETMRLALETLAMAKRRYKLLGDIMSEIREIAGIYAMYLTQNKDEKLPKIQNNFLQQSQSSEDLTRSLRAKPWPFSRLQCAVWQGVI
jgi:hypothetical protein